MYPFIEQTLRISTMPAITPDDLIPMNMTQMRSRYAWAVAPAAVLSVFLATLCTAQTFPTDDPVIRQMWEVGIEHSQTESLAHTLLDYYGPRLAGSPNLAASQEWLLERYEEWGVPVRKEEYGTWTAWQQGILHLDMIEPRIRTLEVRMLAFSPGSDGTVEGEVVLPPEGMTSDTVVDWLATIKGKFVLWSAPEAMCRASQELEKYARPETVEKLEEARMATRRAWDKRTRTSERSSEWDAALDAAEPAAVLTSYWSGGWGVNRIFDTSNKNAVGIDVSCEDYGLLYRLADNGETPVLRMTAEAQDLGVVPQFNVIAELKGNELPDEYVLLGAHLDSWHSASGATDNGTGTITMLEAMRILKKTYPNPRRTIVVGHWGAEEMGLIGSSAFREDHPEVMDGLQVAFNQDNGTWRFERIEGQGMLDFSGHISRWMTAVPTEFSEHILLEMPGVQNNRGSDHVSFLCAGAPSFRLQSPYDEYRQYTWHTNRDTYDKIVFDDLKENATVAAMLAYMASEDPERVGRSRALLPIAIDPRTGQPRLWPECRQARREPR